MMSIPYFAYITISIQHRINALLYQTDSSRSFISLRLVWEIASESRWLFELETEPE